ncbi:hypothetical protein CUJ83_08775 [Methanocella sp. CWC-04]|uniref:CAAX protease self-immunity n=1 Tax=Methanooceanicella nereidis TaxID=2052831 RepID=A0AAP2RFD0_9EURY|nr:hypothetical protein [Methanocella sp. CWC-04]MCD1295090.1 hypothetical protein [Methanocella sp. CWC-04]
MFERYDRNVNRASDIKDINIKGIAVLSAFIVLFIAIYALWYPLAVLRNYPYSSIFFYSPNQMIYLALSVTGIWAAFKYRKNIDSMCIIVGLLFASLIWVSTQAKYWYNGWISSIPYYEPTVYAVMAFVMVTGAIGLLRSHKVLNFNMSEGNAAGALKGFLFGALIGIPIAIMNVLMIICVNGDTAAVQNIFYQALQALRPGIMEEVAYRLIFFAISLTVLLKYLPKNVAVLSSIFMAAAFHAAIHVPELFAQNIVAAMVMTIVMSVLFGLPMAILAYKKDIETAIGFHWVIDALRFSLGI